MMEKNKLGLAFTFGLLLVTMLAWPSTAQSRRGYVRSLPVRHETIGFRGQKIHFFAGRFYRPVRDGFYIIPPPIGATVSFLPDGYLTVVAGGLPYYYYDNVYYRSYNTEYVVVAPPIEDNTVDTLTYAPTVEAAGGMVFTVNVPNSRGSFNEVKLTQYGNGFLGPQGEYYPGHPTVDQLKVLYGK